MRQVEDWEVLGEFLNVSFKHVVVVKRGDSHNLGTKIPDFWQSKSKAS